MKLDRSTEKKTLTELVRLFGDPAATAKRYARNAKLSFLSAVLCGVAAGITSGSGLPDAVTMLLMVVSGVFIGSSIFLGSSAKQVGILKQHCSLNTDSVQRRLDEIG